MATSNAKTKTATAKKKPAARKPAAAKPTTEEVKVKATDVADELDTAATPIVDEAEPEVGDDEPNHATEPDPEDLVDELDVEPKAKEKPAKAEARVGHLKGCPAERIESYDAETPAGEPLTITRCVDCGANL
ncbi:MAG: hypothetical protein ACJ76I_11840 [Gaiellaceae bacterium]